MTESIARFEIGDGIRCDPQQAQDGWRIQIAYSRHL
jgi:hypothetical protein